jgi:hypothetical protein
MKDCFDMCFMHHTDSVVSCPVSIEENANKDV